MILSLPTFSDDKVRKFSTSVINLLKTECWIPLCTWMVFWTHGRSVYNRQETLDQRVRRHGGRSLWHWLSESLEIYSGPWGCVLPESRRALGCSGGYPMWGRTDGSLCCVNSASSPSSDLNYVATARQETPTSAKLIMQFFVGIFVNFFLNILCNTLSLEVLYKKESHW